MKKKNRKQRRAARHDRKSGFTQRRPSREPFPKKIQDELNHGIERALVGEKKNEQTIGTIVNGLGVAAAVWGLRIGVTREQFLHYMDLYHQQVCEALGVDPITARPLDEDGAAAPPLIVRP